MIYFGGTETLTKNGADYYVKIEDLNSKSSLKSIQWCAANLNLPNVPVVGTIPNYNGKITTYYMSKDSRNLGHYSPAADYANSNYFLNKRGYIGTKEQLEFIINNQNVIASGLIILGDSIGSYMSQYIWYSQKYDATGCGFWQGGFWGAGSMTHTFKCMIFY